MAGVKENQRRIESDKSEEWAIVSTGTKRILLKFVWTSAQLV